MSIRHEDPARERLLDASLSEVFGRRDAASQEPVENAVAAPMPWSRYLVAAVVVLGAAVVVGSWTWSRPADDDRSFVGRPLPLPELLPQEPQWPQTVCNTLEELEAAPADIVSLAVTLPEAKDLPRLARFTALRELRLLGQGSGTFKSSVGGDLWALKPLEKLQRLEKLSLPPGFALVPPHVQSLAEIGSLRSLAISGTNPLGADLARAIAALPALRELELHLALVPATFLENLAGAELSSLRLEACCNLGAEEFAALSKLRSLESVGILFAGRGSCSIDGKRYKIHELGQAAFDALNKLPNLIALDLDESQFHDKFMARLPKQLRYLRLGDHVMTPLTIAALQRLDDLEELRFNQATKTEDTIELLQKLRLKRLWLRGWLDRDVVKALAEHLTLEHATLRLHGQKPVDLTALANAPKLRKVTLRYDGRMNKAALPSAEVRKALADGGVTVVDAKF